MNPWWLAIGLLLILEGVGPLCVPKFWRQLMQEVARADPALLRRIGGVLVVSGVVILLTQIRQA